MPHKGSPPGGGGGGPTPEAANHTITHTDHQPRGRRMSDATATERQGVSSQQVSWWSVHEYILPFLKRVGAWPMAGTPEWCDLPDSDPAKTAALFEAASHHALRIETAQELRAQASHDISEAADWSAIATEASRRREAYIPREVAG